MNLQILGLKLSRYRDQLTESLDEVAIATGIDAERLRLIEEGQLEPSGDEILILADHYHCDFKFFISNEQVAPFEQTDTLYRAHGREFSKNDRIAVQEFLYLCDTEEFLMQELNRRPTDFSYRPSGNYFKGNGEGAAAAFRKTMGHDDRQVPRDIYAEFRSVGVHVFRRKLGNSNISGLFIVHPTAGRCALVNYSEDVYRQRFSAAHEMAHAIFDSKEGPSVSFYRHEQVDRREVRANRFASCYLMPPAFLQRLPAPSGWSEADAQKWANELRVSCDALGIALKEAELVDARISAKIRGFRVPRESKIDPELPENLTEIQRARKTALLERGLSDHYVGLCLDAHSQSLISLGRLSEALLCSHGELAEIASLYGRRIHGN
ncbi:XRE family transcriptional regulator [Sulfuritalea sp.]|uniref:XRE family transcriptional regulator n=1 Tax=Sulfuritalea sp. TaxID=2480090 RepID=UPI00286D7D6F|nr:XRE family transcriptional regulator [Sulfuritalea sp.]